MGRGEAMGLSREKWRLGRQGPGPQICGTEDITLHPTAGPSGICIF